MRYLVIGGGQAGLSAVSKLRELDSTATIDLLCSESVLPYQRPPLSKSFLSGSMSMDRLLLRPESWFTEQGIEVHLSTVASHIDCTNHEVATTDNRVFPYDKLLLCTGSYPRSLPESQGGTLQGVHTLRFAADAESLRSSLESSRRLSIIGGGYIGLEVAAMARKLDLSVDIIELSPRILNRVACSETSDYFRSLHERHGVRFHESTPLKRIVGTDGRVSAIELESGETLESDCVVCGIGVLPETSLAESSGITTDDGITIDSHCTTSDPSIYAAGDCANYRVRFESVPNAIYQGELSAHSMVGIEFSKSFVPWFWSDQYDIKLQIAGYHVGYDRTIVRHADTGDGCSIWYFRGDEFLAVDSINDSFSFMSARRYLSDGVSPLISDVENTHMSVRDWKLA